MIKKKLKKIENIKKNGIHKTFILKDEAE